MTQVEIANIALMKLGHTTLISDLEEDSVEARSVNAAWGYVRQQMLSYHPWAFATKSALLATVGTPSSDAWAYRYRWPTDCLLPVRIEDDLQERLSDDRIQWVHAMDDSTGTPVSAIDTDMSPATFVYIFDHTEVSLWPPHFVHAFAYALSAEISMAITSEPSIQEGMSRMAYIELTKAMSTDLRTSGEIRQIDSEFIKARL